MQAFQLTTERVDRGQLAFSPDGRWLGVGTRPFTLIDTTDGSTRPIPQRTARGGTFVWDFAFIRGGAAIAYTPIGGELWAFDLETRELRTRKFQGGDAHGVAADPRGESFYVTFHPPISSDRNGDLRRIDSATLRQKAAFAPGRYWLWEPAISADGNWLAAREGWSVWVWNVGGKSLPARPASRVKARERDPAFALSADGALLATADRFGLRLWRTKGGKEVLSSGKHKRSVTAVACSPTKPLIATGDNAGNVFFWDHAGNVLTRYDFGLGEVAGLAFAADGLRCAAVDTSGKVVIWDVDA